MLFKRQAIESRLDVAIKEWDGAGAEPSNPNPPDGASLKEIKDAWRYTDDVRNQDFNERLPQSERSALLTAQQQGASRVQQFDQQTHSDGPPRIEGVYLEQIAPA